MAVVVVQTVVVNFFTGEADILMANLHLITCTYSDIWTHDLKKYLILRTLASAQA